MKVNDIEQSLTRNPITFSNKFSGIPAYTSVIIVLFDLGNGMHVSEDGSRRIMLKYTSEVFDIVTRRC